MLRADKQRHSRAGGTAAISQCHAANAALRRAITGGARGAGIGPAGKARP